MNYSTFETYAWWNSVLSKQQLKNMCIKSFLREINKSVKTKTHTVVWYTWRTRDYDVVLRLTLFAGWPANTDVRSTPRRTSPLRSAGDDVTTATNESGRAPNREPYVLYSDPPRLSSLLSCCASFAFAFAFVCGMESTSTVASHTLYSIIFIFYSYLFSLIFYCRLVTGVYICSSCVQDPLVSWFTVPRYTWLVTLAAETEISRRPSDFLLCTNISLKWYMFFYDIENIFLCALPTSSNGRSRLWGGGSASGWWSFFFSWWVAIWATKSNAVVVHYKLEIQLINMLLINSILPPFQNIGRF